MFKSPKNLILTVSCGVLLASCASPSAQNDSSSSDSHYVKVGETSGYYILRPDSPLRDKLGLSGAPLQSTSGQIHNGRGRDVIAFRFDKNGVLSAPPAYIYQSQPESFYTERLKGLSIGRSTYRDVKGLFSGSTLIPEQDGSLLYITFRVRNVSERMP